MDSGFQYVGGQQSETLSARRQNRRQIRLGDEPVTIGKQNPSQSRQQALIGGRKGALISAGVGAGAGTG